MRFNENELLTIQKAIGGWFKKSARQKVATSLSQARIKIERAKNLSADESKAELINLLNQATEQRHLALQSGANSYGHPDWAAASAVESWLQELLLGDLVGIKRVEAIVDKLSNAR